VSEEHANSSPSGRLKVFVSYARADLDFVDQLVLALEDKGFEALIDRHNIDAAENWQDRLSALIAMSDTVVFVLSPKLATSTICQWEVTEAAKQSKRLIPIVATALKNTDAPPELSALNYIHFYKDETVPGSGFYDGVRKLERALKVDLGWLRLQTRLAEDTGEWQQSKSDDKLLRGASLDEALQWLQRTPPGQTVTQSVRSFLRESEKAEALRKSEAASRIAEREETLRKLSRRTTVGLVGASGLTLLSGGLAWWGLDAESRFQAERERVAKAEAEALKKRIEAEAARTDIEGQITVYAAAPGELAQDGESGGNSPFTTAAMLALNDENIAIQQALVSASLSVSRKTNGLQRPFIATNINGDIYLLKRRMGQTRRALCISVAKFTGTDTVLANVERDAGAWRAFFVKAGFEVRELKDPKLSDVLSAVEWLWSSSGQKHGYRRTKNPYYWPAKIQVVPRVGGSSPETLEGSPGLELPPAADEQPESVPRTPAPIIVRNPDLMVCIFFAGIGIASGGKEYLALFDSEIASDGKLIENVLDVAAVKNELRLRAGLSAMLLDTNFNPVETAVGVKP
jgi:hypothetical protein